MELSDDNVADFNKTNFSAKFSMAGDALVSSEKLNLSNNYSDDEDEDLEDIELHIDVFKV